MKTKSKKKEIKVRLTNQDFDHLNNLVKESSLSGTMSRKRTPKIDKF